MRITIIGSGNVATHMAAAFKNAGHRIVQVYSPTMQNAAMLAYHVGAEAIDQLAGINPETDIFIIAVKDDAIMDVAKLLAPYNKLTVHTSGATSISALEIFTANCGVLYPLQTFNKIRELNFLNVPLCIEGADDEITKQLQQLAQTISNKVYKVSSDQRKILHLAAVFACNFPNYLYHVAEQLLNQNQLDFNIIRPLIDETAQKVQHTSPAKVQTGPAVRGDEKTMRAHLALLNNSADLQAIYQLLSQAIIKMDKSE
ncbi:DUF2520 domain-containing protein [Mucilaginibacter sp. UR6-1]|uniref:Rossmann-like and DUF2520 domain-containing protein n=1 Tax=Mucilaginibacter sp. UR6-1 TaxID=1435643 RepID=UPI001E4A0523|nr:DUF2520 domain-containing protein [Mucilaginibacter sp. UR6-1]MCC8407347.1 DUF2520 domain-containing protein [Mucilaginibacter sp. UR6-1]